MENIAEIELSYKPTNIEAMHIRCSQDAYKCLIEFFPKQTLHLREQFNVAFLNRHNKVIGVLQHSIGGITSTSSDGRLIFATALKCAASGMILAHNHPSGNLKASKLDIDFTRRMYNIGELLEIKVIDHIIIGDANGGYYSFADNGFDGKDKLS